MPEQLPNLEALKARLEAARLRAVQVLQELQPSEPGGLGTFKAAYELEPGVVPEWIMVVPRGVFHHPIHGLTDASAELLELIKSNLGRNKNDLVIDFNHQSISDYDAPAAGFSDQYEVRHGGLWAHIAYWTEKAVERFENREYRWVSPVINFMDWDRTTGAFIGTSLHSIALTNTPQIDGMPDISALFSRRPFPAAHSAPATALEIPMKYALLLAALGLEATATDEEAVAAFNARLDTAVEERIAAGSVTETQESEVVAEFSAKVQRLEAELAARPTLLEHARLEADLLGAKARAQVIEDRIPPALQETAKALFSSSPADYERLKGSLPRVPQGIEMDPARRSAPRELTEQQLQLCSQLNITPAQFSARLAARRN